MKKLFPFSFVVLVCSPWFLCDLKEPTTLTSENAKKIVKKNKLKKLLKKEIQNRKRQHNILLKEYNNSFNQKSLELIKNNSLILSNLEKGRSYFSKCTYSSFWIFCDIDKIKIYNSYKSLFVWKYYCTFPILDVVVVIHCYTKPKPLLPDWISRTNNNNFLLTKY